MTPIEEIKLREYLDDLSSRFNGRDDITTDIKTGFNEAVIKIKSFMKSVQAHQPAPVEGLRPELQVFAEAMEKRLKEKDHLVESGEWQHWRNAGLLCMEGRMAQGWQKYWAEITKRPQRLVDLANFAMMLYDILEGKSESHER
jgi:hypothetical protein